MKCLTCGYSVEDAKMMEDHCKYLGHTGYIEEGKSTNAVIQEKKELKMTQDITDVLIKILDRLDAIYSKLLDIEKKELEEK